MLHRFLLGFGSVTEYIGYNAMSDFFPTMSMKPNPQCSSSHCKQRQTAEHKPLLKKVTDGLGEDSQSDTVVHEDNVWGKWLG